MKSGRIKEEVTPRAVSRRPDVIGFPQPVPALLSVCLWNAPFQGDFVFVLGEVAQDWFTRPLLGAVGWYQKDYTS